MDAQDLLQTALARTYGRWDRIEDKSLADAYLRRVMINTRTEWWRARKLDEVPTEQLPDASIEDGTEQRADRALLMDILGVLAPKQRSVVVLRHWEQMSTEETAAALGMSAGTVKSTLHRALARLRQELENRKRRAGRPGRRGAGAGAVRGLTGSGDEDTVTGRTGGGTAGRRLLTGWAASSAALAGLAVFGLFAVSCSTGARAPGTRARRAPSRSSGSPRARRPRPRRSPRPGWTPWRCSRRTRR